MRRGIQSVGTGIAVLRALTQARGALHLRDIAHATGMPASKVYRYLVSFGSEGVVKQDASSGKYDLGPFAIELGLAALGRLDELTVVLAELSRVTEELRRDAHITVWGSSGPTIVRSKQGPADVSIRVREGAVLPVLSSATGRIWVSHLPEQQTEALVSKELDALHLETKKSKASLREYYDEQLQLVHRHGLARAEEELRPGLNALSGPIFNRDGIAFAMTIIGSRYDFDLSFNGPTAVRFREILYGLTRQLGGSI